MNRTGTDQQKALLDALGQFPEGAYIDQAECSARAPTYSLAVHIGNIARYRLRPSEFEAWQAHWR